MSSAKRKTTLLREFGQSLSLIGMMALTVMASLGLALVAVRAVG